jgi:hypothetical protein
VPATKDGECLQPGAECLRGRNAHGGGGGWHAWEGEVPTKVGGSASRAECTCPERPSAYEWGGGVRTTSGPPRGGARWSACSGAECLFQGGSPHNQGWSAPVGPQGWRAAGVDQAG